MAILGFNCPSLLNLTTISLSLSLSLLSHQQIGYLQTWLLYHNALSAGVAIEDVLKFARSSKEKSRSDSDVIQDLKMQLQEQERLLRTVLGGSGSGSGSGGAATGGSLSGVGTSGHGGHGGTSERSSLLGVANASGSTGLPLRHPSPSMRGGGGGAGVGVGGGGYGSVGQTGTTNVSLGVSVEMGPMGRRAVELAVSSRGQVSSISKLKRWFVLLLFRPCVAEYELFLTDSN